MSAKQGLKQFESWVNICLCCEGAATAQRDDLTMFEAALDCLSEFYQISLRMSFLHVSFLLDLPTAATSRPRLMGEVTHVLEGKDFRRSQVLATLRDLFR